MSTFSMVMNCLIWPAWCLWINHSWSKLCKEQNDDWAKFCRGIIDSRGGRQ